KWDDGEGWEDLGVESKSKSAPLVFVYRDDGGKSRTGLAVVDWDDRLKFATWETDTDSTSWRDKINWG
ncbi:hypothetical protein QBC44DRAFT_334054, partial [Cladorrhinum sp. PSN332]